MAYLETRGVGGGKKVRLRVTRSYLFKCIKAQQQALQDMSKELSEKRELHARILEEQVRLRYEKAMEEKSFPGATALAPIGLPEPIHESELFLRA